MNMLSYLDSSSSKTASPSRQHQQPQLLGSIVHTMTTRGDARISLGASWPVMMIRGGRPSVSVRVASPRRAIGGGLVVVQGHLATRTMVPSLSSSSLDCTVSVSPRTTASSTTASSTRSDTTTSPTTSQHQHHHPGSSFWNLRLGTSLRTPSDWSLRPLLQLRLAARRGLALLLSWTGGSSSSSRKGHLNCRCDCILWSSSSNWRLSILLWSRSGGGLRWTFLACCGPAVTLQLPIYIGGTADWWWTVGGSLVLSLVQYLLDRTLLRPPSSSASTRAMPPTLASSPRMEQQQQRAHTQQRLMARQASRQLTWERQRQGLVIEQAVYYSTSSAHHQSSLDVTIPLQFWVHHSTLRLYASAPRRNMLGFCALDEDTTGAAAARLRIEYTYGGSSRYRIDDIADDEEITLPSPRARPVPAPQT